MTASTRRAFLRGGTVAAGAAVSAAQQSGRKTNVVFILTDDHGAWTLGSYGCAGISTPHLDKLASTGTRFTHAYAATPVCSPSRMTYLTGKLPAGHGVYDHILPKDTKAYLDGQLTFTEVLARNGYRVGLSGKWHMGGDTTAHAGFTYWNTIPGPGGTYKNPEFIRNGSKVKTTGFKTDLVTDAALDFITENKDRPFFLFVPFFAPHTPYDYQPPKYRERYEADKFECFPTTPPNPQRRRRFDLMHQGNEAKISYSALVTGVDSNVGRIGEHLEKLGLRGDTLIVFSADQGWAAGHHGFWGKGNGTIPFNMYEESIRVPLIWNHPGRVRAGAASDGLVSSYDFFPTILDYLGVNAPVERSRPGVSYTRLLNTDAGADAQDRALAFEYCYVRAIRTRDFKYIERAENWPSELFDLRQDPGETINVIGAQQHRATLTDLRSRLRTAFERTGAPPLADWRKTVRQELLPIDHGYYDDWLSGTARGAN